MLSKCAYGQGVAGSTETAPVWSARKTCRMCKNLLAGARQPLYSLALVFALVWYWYSAVNTACPPLFSEVLLKVIV